jgi:uncharacterized DUF497 family protein
MTSKFEWDGENTSHIARHGIEPYEAEEVILNDPIDLAITLRNGEERIEQIGETATGRILRVVTTLRQDKIRIVTAIPLKSRWHSRYFAMKEQRNARNKSSP